MADSLGLSGTNDGSFHIDLSGSSLVKHTESSKTVTLKLNDSSDLDSRNVAGKLPHSNLLQLVDEMYATAFARASLGTLGLPGPYSKSSYEPFMKKNDSFIIGGFIDEVTGLHLRKWLNIEQSIKVCYFVFA